MSSPSRQLLLLVTTAPAAEESKPIEEILITPQLAARPTRPPDHAAEVAALHTVARSFASSPTGIFQTLVNVSLTLCRATTTGLSLLETQSDGTERLRWVAMAGALSDRVGTLVLRSTSPCGLCLDRQTFVLLDRPARRFSHFRSAPAEVAEALIVPVPETDGPIGTIWAISHDPARRFDAEDLRQLTSLAAFAAAGVAAARLRDAEQKARELADRTSAVLRRSNEDLEDFSHIVAHDLKEPVRAIRHHAACLAEDSGQSLGADGIDRLGKIDRVAERMSGMLAGLLEYSRAGHGDLAVAPTDLREVAAVVIESLDDRIQQDCAEVMVSGSMPVVRCDAARIGEVFANLILNGLKYNRSQPKRVEIGCVPGATDPQVFYVKDNGVGISEEDSSGLFRMFTRLRGSAALSEGSGSGLALARKIIDRHSGCIWLRSALGKGTTFFFTLAPGRELPQFRSPDSRAAPAHAAVADEATAGSS